MRSSRLPRFASQARKRQSSNASFVSVVHLIVLCGAAVFLAQTLLG